MAPRSLVAPVLWSWYVLPAGLYLWFLQNCLPAGDDLLYTGWNDRQVSIDFMGSTSSLTGKVVDSSTTGCVVELVPERKPRESRARRISCPWTAIRAIELLEELHEPRRPTPLPRPFHVPECPVT
jgi:hypothetical protein